MTIVDTRGRLFGRINLVDATALAFLLVLLPMAYGTYLLFRPAIPRIDSVSPSVITKEERRISAGGRLTAKFKVKGTGFTPLLRARIGNDDALGFVFENPNSADVLVGPIAPGAHDLVLLDGVQEVARATGAITVQPDSSSFVRAVGWLTNLDPELLGVLKQGLAYPQPEPAFEIVALGPERPGRSHVRLGGSTVDLKLDDRVEREAVMTLRCSPASDDNPCTIGGPDGLRSQVVLSLPGPTRYFAFSVQELLPPTPAIQARIRIRVPAGIVANLVQTGDRDSFLDDRAAVVTAISREPGGIAVILALRLDDSREGWRYRQQRVKPGAELTLNTDRYELTGRIETIELLASPPVPAP